MLRAARQRLKAPGQCLSVCRGIGYILHGSQLTSEGPWPSVLTETCRGAYDAKKAWLGKLKPTYILVPECPSLTMALVDGGQGCGGSALNKSAY